MAGTPIGEIVLRLPIVLALSLAAPAIVSAAAAPAPADGIALVQQHLASVSSMTAAFSQTDRNNRTVTGTMSLKRPGKIRFQYEKGVPQLIVADGNSLYFIDYQVKQVSRWPIGSSPLGVLLNPKRDVTQFAKLLPTQDSRILSVEVRDPKHPEYGRITMVFQKNGTAPGGLMLLGWVALDSQNNRTTIQLSNQRFNVAIADGTFAWSDPRRSGGPKR
ncbi:outer membrane lipoprotein carrier protein LolA [Sphingomonas sp.]|uniref:LolA family protein n=1 Tax=Sphingomonas sp. TaxID=28214 RepID=UPI001B07D6DE|nr:outer membrane lipoprotein carrier protein LolA [Sphingomonas sp.]MBO9714718.1 outer membrane lipoprotein carrier protein LolA [Sphingomonas sp.]